MKIGIAQNSYKFDSHGDSESCTEHLRLVELALSLGLEGTFVYEHHFTDYLISPAPLMNLSYLAGRHPTKFIGTSVLILPTHSLTRLAGQLAWLDNLCRGNLYVGLGAGRSPAEVQMLSSNSSEFCSSLEELHSLLQPATSATSAKVRPTPEFDVHDRLFVTGSKSNSTAFKRIRGHSPSDSMPPGDIVITPVTVCSDRSSAIAMAERDSQSDLKMRADYYGPGQASTALEDQIVGSPKDLIDEVRTLALHKPAALALEFAFGQRSASEIEDMITLFAAEVLPHLNKLPN